jgi:hypothetical protein
VEPLKGQSSQRPEWKGRGSERSDCVQIKWEFTRCEIIIHDYSYKSIKKSVLTSLTLSMADGLACWTRKLASERQFTLVISPA